MKQGTLSSFFGGKNAAAPPALTGRKGVQQSKEPRKGLAPKSKKREPEEKESKPRTAKKSRATAADEAPAKRKKKKEAAAEESDEEDIFELEDEEDEEDEEEEEEEEGSGENDEDELELFDDEIDGEPVAKKGRKALELVQFSSSATPRPLALDKEFLSSLVSPAIAASFDQVTPRESTEPQFTTDLATHAKFAKVVSLQHEAVLEQGEDGPSYTSPFASLKKRPGLKYTPLEEQWLTVKRQNPDVVLFVECGYRYKFFGPDAITASKVLGIMCLTDKHFYTASVPVQRLSVHMERLVVAGYKAGVVRQTETAALKQGSESKNKIFSRDLADVYSSATFFGDAVVTESPNPSYMVCIVEDQTAGEITVVAISLSTSDFLYDTFTDTFVRGALETRLVHIAPVEILLGPGLHPATEALVKSYQQRHEKDLRISDQKQPLSAAEAKTFLASAYEKIEVLLNLLETTLSEPVVVCVAILGRYLKLYDLDRAMLLIDGLHRWSRNEMVLTAETLANLQVLDKGKGSLLSLVDRTVSAMGSRLMRQWIGHPLMSADAIVARQDAVEATGQLLNACGAINFKGKHDSPNAYIKLISLLATSGDLEQATSSIYHRRCEPKKFIATFNALKRIMGALEALQSCKDAPNKDTALFTGLLETQASNAPLKEFIDLCLADLDERATEDGNVDWKRLFRARLDEPVPEEHHVNMEGQMVGTLSAALDGVREHEAQLDSILLELRKVVGLPNLQYKSVSGREFLVEIPRGNKKACAAVPADWETDQSTKANLRYMAPEVKEVLLRLNMYREASVLLAKTKWNLFMEQFVELYGSFRSLIGCLSTLDAINSLAIVSTTPGYVRPQILRDGSRHLHIVKGRHPSAETLFTAGSFIANDTLLKEGDVENMILTGPNMGGKSTYIRGVAQTVILAQCGSFVPAESCTMGLFDSVFVRMGAEDDLFSGRSTFMTELLSASAILESATERSLVIIDELGRGTSTFDGTSIAYATLRYLAESIRCLSFFVTHYPLIGSLASTHSNVGNSHLGYVVNEEEQGRQQQITFLFTVCPGLETRSYGLNVARLALSGFEDMLAVASHKAKEMEAVELDRRHADFIRIYKQLAMAIEKGDTSLLENI